MSTKHIPILFSAPMVRALLDGSKTQTRRVVKAKHLPWLENSLMNFLDGKWNQRPLPYGQPGDRLWVREKWSGEHCYHQDPPSQRVSVMTPDGPMFRDAIWYWADGEPEYGDWERPRPSIHMPRWASRITLEITGVRVERLQDISEADAIAEGIEPFTDFHPTDHWRRYDKGTFNSYCGPIESYASLWESINGPESWNANPWVWVLEFKRVKGGAA